ncbi:MAG: FkbM family methyltransferase [Marivirga sp.]|nr:FkbM family methyltransferase [Marivirga sp.]
MTQRIYKKLISVLRNKLEDADEIVKHLKVIPRYTPGSITFLNHQLKYADSASLLFTYKEIFKESIYKFTPTSRRPFIIDAGANIGLSVLYFKQLIPDAKILAFEPDGKIFSVLGDNVKEFGLNDVTLVNKGLWNDDQNLRFHSEGADAGRISDASDAVNVIAVTRLSTYLTETVDLLKIDIEGAETVVLQECKDYLHHVRNIFVEYHSFVGQEQSLPELLSILKQSGFRVNINAPGLVSKNPFIKVNAYNGMDMQLNIYGVRN